MGPKTSSATSRELKVVENGQAVVKGEIRGHLTAMTANVISEVDAVMDLEA